MSIDNLKSEVYSSIDDVKAALKKNTDEAIEEMAKSAEALAEVSFGYEKLPEVTIPKNEEQHANNNHVSVDLGNGENARVDITTLEKLRP